MIEISHADEENASEISRADEETANEIFPDAGKNANENGIASVGMMIFDDDEMNVNVNVYLSAEANEIDGGPYDNAKHVLVNESPYETT